MIVLNNVKLRNLREEKGLTQEMFADKIIVTKNMIIQYECGAKQPSVARLRKMAECLGCSMDDLVCEVSVEPESGHIPKFGEPSTS